ncbi:hypothetical protein ACFYKX_02150 [Cytobacillus sp. FJAT-54145]|uniref:Uncharacterized protein n=1 Tax=Cytobacillus spartinae TaxID=3299023 RepID=A0ABW6K5G2_9BACI
MINRATKASIGFVIGAFIGILMGFHTGTNLGGNYFADFIFHGLRGYEATGFIGAILGALLGGTCGLVISLTIGLEKVKKHDSSQFFIFM